MRFLHLIFAAFLLVSSAATAACHGVGDVHIICKDGQISPLYVENEAAQDTDNKVDCCPMAGFAAAETHKVHAIGTAQTISPPLPRGADKRHADAPALPRGPPARLFF